MTATNSWHEPAIRRLAALLEPNPAVRALVLFGSTVVPAQVDYFSDIDALVVLADEALPDFYPDLAWLAPLGSVIAVERHESPHTRTVRVALAPPPEALFADVLYRFDLVLTIEAALAQLDRWDHVAFAARHWTLFSRSPVTDRVLDALERPPTAAAAAGPPTPATVSPMADVFFWKAIVAVNKVVRGDLLIGLHLALDCQRECLVLGMMLRDRHGTDRHNTVEQVTPPAQPDSAAGILDSLARLVGVFDRLAVLLNDDYQPRASSLKTYIQAAHEMLATQVNETNNDA